MTYYQVAHREPDGSSKVYDINVTCIAYFSTVGQGAAGRLQVEIGLSGGNVLKLDVDQGDWSNFTRRINPHGQH
jgi:hypothetical protein